MFIKRNKYNYSSTDFEFTGKLDKDNRATMFFITENQQKTVLSFSLDSLIVSD